MTTAIPRGSRAHIDHLNAQAIEAAAIDLPHAAQLALEAYQLAVIAAYPQGQAEALYVTALFYYFRSEYPQSLEKLKQALSLYLAIGDEAGRVRHMTLLGNLYQQMGDLAAALAVYQEQLAILDRVDDKKVRVRVLNGIGGIYYYLKQPNETVANLEPALVLARELGLRLEEAVILGNLCDSISALGDHEQAIQLGLDAVQIAENHASVSPVYRHAILAALGMAYLRYGRYGEAENYLQQAYQLSLDAGSDAQRAGVLAELCHLELERGQSQKALDYGLRAIDKLPPGGEKPIYEVFEWIAQAYHALGDLEKAWQYLQRYQELSRTLFAERSNQRVRLLEVTLKTDNARREAEFYQQRTRDLVAQAERTNAYFARLNQLKDDLLNTTSHNLKNPISTIRTAAYLLGRMPEVQFSKGMEYVDTIMRQTATMEHLLVDVLELAKLETGTALDMRETLLNSLLRDCITNFNFSATQKNIALVLELPEESIRLTSDARLLTQALHNLLSNAIKYTPEGSVTLRAQVNDSEVVITVTDTGIGIPADALSHIFERFYRVKEHSIIFEGTGLGLSIAQTIIRQHRGTLTVESEPGRGSTFTIRLPR